MQKDSLFNAKMLYFSENARVHLQHSCYNVIEKGIDRANIITSNQFYHFAGRKGTSYL